LDLFFSNNKLKKTCSEEKQGIKDLGPVCAKRLRQRLEDLAAAETLADMGHLPPARCHALDGKRAGQFAVDLAHPHRLIFRPDHDPPPRKEDGGWELEAITRIEILEIVDYH
jgi:proteic killer suppression protein